MNDDVGRLSSVIHLLDHLFLHEFSDQSSGRRKKNDFGFRSIIKAPEIFWTDASIFFKLFPLWKQKFWKRFINRKVVFISARFFFVRKRNRSSRGRSRNRLIYGPPLLRLRFRFHIFFLHGLQTPKRPMCPRISWFVTKRVMAEFKDFGTRVTNAKIRFRRLSIIWAREIASLKNVVSFVVLKGERVRN